MKGFIEFVKQCPTSIHTCAELSKKYKKNNFTQVYLTDTWTKSSSHQFLTENGFLAAWKIPKVIEKIQLIACHTDSPGLKLKPNPVKKSSNSLWLQVEPYGEPILNSWLNRTLYVAGTLCVLKNDQVQIIPVCFQDFKVVIPQLALHLERELNTKGCIVNKQEHLLALCDLDPIEGLEFENILQQFESFDKLIHHDLYLVPLDEATPIGLKKDIMSAPRVDNMASVYALSESLLNTTTNDRTLQLAAFFDHEEIGSRTMTGADSVLLSQIIERILSTAGLDRQQQQCIIHRSQALSLDMAHGYHAGHDSKFDEKNKVFLGQGVVIKHHPNGKYANNLTILKNLLCNQKVKFQHYSHRSDLPCGSTLGPMLSSNLAIPTQDIGIAQLSMHAYQEIFSIKDLEMLTQTCIDFYQYS